MRHPAAAASDNVEKFQWLNDRGPRAPNSKEQIAHDTALSQRRLDLQMQALSDRIRAIPDEIASVDGAMKATRPSNVIPFE